MRDPETKRDYERVFLFNVDSEDDISAAEAWVERHYPMDKEEGQ